MTERRSYSRVPPSKSASCESHNRPNGGFFYNGFQSGFVCTNISIKAGNAGLQRGRREKAIGAEGHTQDGRGSGLNGTDSLALTKKRRYLDSRVSFAIACAFLIACMIWSLPNLSHGVYWAFFLWLAVPIGILASSAEPGETEDYPLKIGRSGAFMVIAVMLAGFLAIAVIVNGSYDDSMKSDAFMGATTGGFASIAVAIGYRGFIWDR